MKLIHLMNIDFNGNRQNYVAVYLDHCLMKNKKTRLPIDLREFKETLVDVLVHSGISRSSRMLLSPYRPKGIFVIS